MNINTDILIFDDINPMSGYLTEKLEENLKIAATDYKAGAVIRLIVLQEDIEKILEPCISDIMEVVALFTKTFGKNKYNFVVLECENMSFIGIY